ncbi:hypothetical protein PLESTB_000851700 [Pleodorina starrii]|uniref:Expansin-like EG45 domain-containing protein n=1 Tax=Pleodorina starrii TaxID=330485 RepID=A0A9W6F2T1_9CHLO|nr:hypothetical protein PLESTB_000851700 [Pleodorina starrii]
MEGFASSCGKCYEIKCRNADFSDGNGEYLQRSNACYDESKSVIITIVDACPCHYPSNSHSNRRWCCGDMVSFREWLSRFLPAFVAVAPNHIDISYEAFQQIADLGIGVIGLYYREVDCSSKASVGNGGGSSSNGNGNAGGNSNGNSGSSGGLNWGGW